jgi:hypothetical protein
LSEIPFVFKFAIQKHKDENTQKYNIACCFDLLWNSVPHIEGRTQTVAREQRAEEAIWA